ncbi:SAM-dependent methyltransferase [Streptomyces profundus]|uniref:SAM-dependent methyltransferase n=1 Tax=Streptomyces profundus TaxID=2867410 RepID=UPI001D16CAF5|nr:class I SAM-dependent methyltransferase [Streptomyces sp. MA3_2.13]UED84529.1 class I SAM-dependent methyltransferase [Streptomyces sp. MA3_2.13]
MTDYNRHLITHANHPIAAPLADERVDVLLDRALAHRPRGGRLLDLGCGQAAWPLRALATRPEATAVGVDLDQGGLDWAAAEAERTGVADRLRLVRGDAAAFAEGTFDAVLCVGATHAFGGLSATLEAARPLLAADGRLVVGEGFWERAPDRAALDELDASPDDYADLAGTVRLATDAGWVPVHGHVSTLAEWDDYEWNWTGSLASWALDHPDHPHAPEAATTAASHRDGWLTAYRSTLGFLTLILRRSSATA